MFVDAVKHMGALACSIFSSNIREYAYRIGKRGFFLFGEIASADDALLDRYIRPNTWPEILAAPCSSDSILRSTSGWPTACVAC